MPLELRRPLAFIDLESTGTLRVVAFCHVPRQNDTETASDLGVEVFAVGNKMLIFRRGRRRPLPASRSGGIPSILAMG